MSFIGSQFEGMWFDMEGRPLGPIEYTDLFTRKYEEGYGFIAYTELTHADGRKITLSSVWTGSNSGPVEKPTIFETKIDRIGKNNNRVGDYFITKFSTKKEVIEYHKKLVESCKRKGFTNVVEDLDEVGYGNRVVNLTKESRKLAEKNFKEKIEQDSHLEECPNKIHIQSLATGDSYICGCDNG